MGSKLDFFLEAVVSRGFSPLKLALKLYQRMIQEMLYILKVGTGEFIVSSDGC